MKVYLFGMGNDGLWMREFEVKETPKMYKNIGWGIAVRKENVNRAVAHGTPESANRCFLTENNPDKAIKILIEQEKLYIEWVNNKHKKLMMEKYKKFK